MNGELQDRVHTTIDKATHDELLTYCSRYGVKKAEFIRRAIRDALRAVMSREMEPLNSERPL